MDFWFFSLFAIQYIFYCRPFTSTWLFHTTVTTVVTNGTFITLITSEYTSCALYMQNPMYIGECQEIWGDPRFLAIRWQEEQSFAAAHRPHGSIEVCDWVLFSDQVQNTSLSPVAVTACAVQRGIQVLSMSVVTQYTHSNFLVYKLWGYINLDLPSNSEHTRFIRVSLFFFCAV